MQRAYVLMAQESAGRRWKGRSTGGRWGLGQPQHAGDSEEPDAEGSGPRAAAKRPFRTHWCATERQSERSAGRGAGGDCR